MKLVDYAIKKYRLTAIGIILLLFLGSLSYYIIPLREDPLIKVPGATVLVQYPGAGSRDIERYVSRPLEEKINEIEEVDKITSSSSQGTSLILIEFDPDSKMDQNMQSLREKVRDAQKDLPDESFDPEIIRWKTETVSLIINLSGPFTYRELYKYAKYIKRHLDKIPQIMTLTMEGDQEREVHVEVDERRLSQYMISLEEVIGQIRAENVSLPGGHMDVGRRRYQVRTNEEFRDLADIGRTIIGSYDGRPVFLADLAQIHDSYERPEYLVRFNGRKSVNLLVTQKPIANLLSVSQEIRDCLNDISNRLPPQLQIKSFADQSISVNQSVKTFQNNLILGAGIVVFVTILLMNLRMAFIVSLIIPLSIAFSLIILYFSGHTLNQVTFTSMVLVLGILVDNGIVVVENIQRHISMGTKRLSATLNGSREVLGAITASTLTTILAFIPMLFMKGDTGQFIRGIPITIISALLGSLLVAIFVSPLLSHRFLKRHHQHQSAGNRIIKGYLRILQFCLNHKFFTLFLAMAAFIGSLVIIPFLGLQFFPKAEKDTFIIEATLPQMANIETTLAVAKRIEKVLLTSDDIENVMTHVGKHGPRIYYNINMDRPNQPNKAQFFVTTKNDQKNISTSHIIAELRPLMRRIPGSQIKLMELEQGPPVGSPIAIKIKGDDLGILGNLASDFSALLETIPGAVDITDDASDFVPQIELKIDSDKARLLGITNATIARTMRTAIYGSTAGSFRQEEQEVDVVVSLDDASRNRIETFKEIYLKSITGLKIPFNQVARIGISSDIGTIRRENLTHSVTVRSDVAGELSETVVSQLKNKAASLKIPSGYLVVHEGENKKRTESFLSLGWALFAAFAMVYIVLVSQFNSFKQPFIIALSLPFGLVGAVMGLWVTGYPFGFMAFLGIVSLTGIVVNDAIVLIDFINVSRDKKMNLRQAVIAAGELRFRPVVLTTISTIGGLLPLSIMGGSLWGPMGNVIVFGLTMATFLTLIIIPVIYELMEKSKTLPLQ